MKQLILLIISNKKQILFVNLIISILAFIFLFINTNINKIILAIFGLSNLILWFCEHYHNKYLKNEMA